MRSAETLYVAGTTAVCHTESGSQHSFYRIEVEQLTDDEGSDHRTDDSRHDDDDIRWVCEDLRVVCEVRTDTNGNHQWEGHILYEELLHAPCAGFHVFRQDMHKKVLVCLPLNDAHRAALEASVPEFEFRFNALDDVHAEDVLWADVVLGNAPVSMISQNKHIEWFQSNSAGPDAYLKPGVLPENCMVTNATGAYGLAISEWMLAMWLGIQKDMFLYRDRQNQRQWAPIDRPVRGITGARVLCVGMGDIGSNFARRAHMLGAEVVGVRRTVHPDTPCPDYCLRVVAQSQLDEELPEADLIALSLPGTPETNKMFNAERFARCKDGAILINVGRGTTVDSDALVEALRSGKIFGAGLDVTDPEPLPADHPLWGEPGAIITPHNSGKFSLPKTLDNIVDIFIHNLKRYAEGLPLDNQVNRTTRYAADQNGGHRLLSTL